MPWSDPVISGWLALHVLIGAAGTWLARRYALHRRLLDQPGERRSHAAPTPRGGGIAIALALLLASGWLLSRFPAAAPMLATFALGLALVAAVGWLDDHRPLSPWLRLGAHALASMLFAAGTWAVSDSLWLAGIAFIAPLVLTNVWNFMDGIDGLAASQAAIVAAGFACLATGAWMWLALALAAACCGFLPFNVVLRARIFLGDVGSGALGFAIGGLSTAAIMADKSTWPLALLPLSAFLVDAGLTLLRRVRRGERWWTPHVQHAYQTWSRRLRRHLPVTLAYAAWTGLAMLLALALRNASFTSLIITLLVWYASGSALWLLLQRGEQSWMMENRE